MYFKHQYLKLTKRVFTGFHPETFLVRNDAGLAIVFYCYLILKQYFNYLYCI